MGTYTNQLDAIVETIDGIDGIGRIHDRPRRGDAYNLWVANIDGLDQIRAWEIGLRGGDQAVRRERITGGGHNHVWRAWSIRGWVSLIEPQDIHGNGAEADEIHDTDFASDNYRSVIELGDTIAAAVEDNRRLTSTDYPSGTCLELTLPPQVSEPEALTIGGGFLCWSITIDFDAYTVETP